MQRVINSSSVSERFYIVNRNDGTDATGLTSASAGASAWYVRGNTAPVAITLSNLTAITDAYSAGGFFEYTAGLYRLDVPDAAYASGVDEVVIGLQFTDTVTALMSIELVDYADYKTDVTGLQTDITNLQGDVTAIKAVTDTLSVAAIADGVWDEIISEHATANSAGALYGSLTQTERDAVADNLLKRDLTTITGEAAFSLLQAIRSLRFYSVSAGVLTVYKEDGVTSAWTANLTQETAQPVTAVSPPA